MSKIGNIFLLLFILIKVDCQTISDYDKIGFSYIKGEIYNFEKYLPDNSHVMVTIDDWTTGMRRKVDSKIDSNGRFDIKFFLLNKQSILLSYKSKHTSIVVQPNDTLFLKIDADYFPRKKRYLGNTAKSTIDIQNYIGYRNKNSQFTNRESFKNKRLHDTTDFEEFKIRQDSILKVELDTLEQYFRKNSIDSFSQLWIKENLHLRYLKSYIELYHPMGCTYEYRIQEYIKRVVYIGENISEEYASNASEYANFTNCLHVYVGGIGQSLWSKENKKINLTNTPEQNQENYRWEGEDYEIELWPY